MRLQTRIFGCSGLTLIFSGIFFCMAFVLMIFFISDSQAALNVYEAALCHDGEEISRNLGGESEYFDSTTNTYRTGRSVSYTCNGADGERDITGSIFGIAAASFCVPFLAALALSFGSIALFIRGIFRSVKSSPTLNNANIAFNQGTLTYDQQAGGGVQVVISQETYTAAEVEDKLAKLQALVQQGSLSLEQYQVIEQQLRSRQV